MRNTLILVSSSLICLTLASCDGGVGSLDSKSFLNSLDGPKVSGVHDALLEAAKQAEAQGNFKLAAQSYEQILEKDPENAAALLSLADCYRRDAQLIKSIAVYDAAIIKNPKNIVAKEGKSLALIASGDFDTPAVLLDEVMQSDAKRWKTLNALGILFTTRNMQPEAQQYFKEALKYHPDSASILNNLGLSQALERNFEVSSITLTKASTMAANASIERKRIDLNNALVLASGGKLDEAKAVAEQYLSGVELDNNLGLYAHLAKDDAMAKAYLNKALSDSKIYYPKAWENLEALNKAPAQTMDKPKTIKKVAATKPAKKIKVSGTVNTASKEVEATKTLAVSPPVDFMQNNDASQVSEAASFQPVETVATEVPATKKLAVRAPVEFSQPTDENVPNLEANLTTENQIILPEPIPEAQLAPAAGGSDSLEEIRMPPASLADAPPAPPPPSRFRAQ